MNCYLWAASMHNGPFTHRYFSLECRVDNLVFGLCCHKSNRLFFYFAHRLLFAHLVKACVVGNEGQALVYGSLPLALVQMYEVALHSGQRRWIGNECSFERELLFELTR